MTEDGFLHKAFLGDHVDLPVQLRATGVEQVMPTLREVAASDAAAPNSLASARQADVSMVGCWQSESMHHAVVRSRSTSPSSWAGCARAYAAFAPARSSL